MLKKTMLGIVCLIVFGSLIDAMPNQWNWNSFEALKDIPLENTSNTSFSGKHNVLEHNSNVSSRQQADCKKKCLNGICVFKGKSEVCECLPDYGPYRSNECKACNCGKGHNCTITTSFFGGDTLTCVCRANYKEKNGKCLGPCEPNPCENGGTCMDDGKNFSCICTPDFNGNTCTTKVAACNKKCVNSICVIKGRIQECECLPEYGRYKNYECRACNCGKGNNCTITTSFFGGETISCICKANYKDENGKCVGPCASNPCLNGGTCRVYGNSFSCECTPPYIGYKCEESPCTPNLCLNGGTCEVSGNRFSCKCKPPYSGYKCEESPCTPNPCLNRGTCEVSGNRFSCKCKPPYSGYKCEESPCTSYPCLNGGTCEVSGNRFSCKCKPPYSGYKCEESPCASNPCLNGGTCKVYGNIFSCECKPPYSGYKCEESPCTPNPCLNGGTCGDSGNSFSCECKPPYSGYKCEESPCASNPCLNGGTCRVYDNSFSCECNPPYSGNKCEQKCKCENGSCDLDPPGIRKCVCFPGFGYYKGYTCKACNCGGVFNCTFLVGVVGAIKTCICPTGYIQKNKKCEEISKTSTLPISSSEHLVTDQTTFSDATSSSLDVSAMTPTADICDSKKCLNGKCEVVKNIFKCTCYEGFTGMHCDVKITESKDNSILLISLNVSVIILLLFVIGIFFLVLFKRKSYNV